MNGVRWIRVGHWPVVMVELAVVEARLAGEPAWPRLLSPRERDVYDRLPTSRRRREWLGGRVAAKLVLRRRCRQMGFPPPPPARLPILAMEGVNGRGPPVSPVGGGISISHSHGFAVAVAGDGNTGIDIERLRSFGTEARSLFLNREEMKRLAAAERDDAALPTLVWAFKEAFCKARGLGLFEGMPGPEWLGRSAGGRLSWRWPSGAAGGVGRRRWDASGLILDGYALAVVGAPSEGTGECP